MIVEETARAKKRQARLRRVLEPRVSTFGVSIMTDDDAVQDGGQHPCRLGIGRRQWLARGLLNLPLPSLLV